MILTRVGPLSRLTAPVLRNLLEGSNRNNLKQAVRTKTWYQYRNSVPCDEYINSIKKPFEIFGAALWWWFIWRLFSEYKTLIGPPLPSLSDFTDEELGIPPLEEDP